MEKTMYLTEQNLEEYLKKIFSGKWIHDKAFLDRKRPDYRNDEHKLIVEFDGPRHYTESSRIIADQIRDRKYFEAGYSTVRIPMFIQLIPATIKALFGIDSDITMEYPQGFISDEKTLIMPADFCELGIIKFKSDLDKFSCVKNQIINSLKTKIEKLGNIDLVLPPSLQYLVR